MSNRSTPEQDAAYRMGICKWCLHHKASAGRTECVGCWRKRGTGVEMKVGEQP